MAEENYNDPKLILAEQFTVNLYMYVTTFTIHVFTGCASLSAS